MEYIWILFALISLILFVIGFSITLGLGWTLFIADLLSGSVTTDYYHAQRDFPPSKDGDKKQAGILYIALGLVAGLIAIALL